MLDTLLLEVILKDVLISKDQPFSLYFRKGYKVLSYTQNVDIGDGFDTSFRLASVTKQFIAYGIILLVEKKQLSFDTCVKEIFPSFPAYFETIKIKHLLTHTSGIYDYEDYLEKDYQDKQLKDQDIIPFLEKTTACYFEAGTKYRYSNTAFILLGLIIEKVSKMPLSRYLKQNIFDKLAMFDTIVNIEGETKIKNRAMGHIIVDGKITQKDQYWCSATIGDVGIYSTINDLKKWLAFLRHNEPFLKDNMFKETILKSGEKTGYGMGMAILNYDGKVAYSHSGSTIGTNTLMITSVDLDLDLIFLTNLGPTKTEIIRQNIKELL